VQIAPRAFCDKQNTAQGAAVKRSARLEYNSPLGESLYIQSDDDRAFSFFADIKWLKIVKINNNILKFENVYAKIIIQDRCLIFFVAIAIKSCIRLLIYKKIKRKVIFV